MADREVQDDRAVAAVLRGDAGAFTELVARHQKMVAGIAWRHGFRRVEVEDIVSEVFIKAYRSLPRYRPEHPFSTWLYRLGVNHVIDRARRERRERGRVEMPAEVADPAPGPREHAELEERARIVRAALGEIAPRYRDAILLVHVEGLKVEDAARMLQIPVGTAKTRLMRGREALKKILLRRHPEQFGKPHAL
jgi:RNA polymerase sigma-70 factor (ECF subfamily)